MSSEGLERKRRSNHVHSFVVFGALIIMVLCGTWPLGSHLTDSVVCTKLASFAPADGDPYLFLWNAYHCQRWLRGSEASVLFSSMLFSPDGLDLTYHTLTLINSIPMALLRDYLTPAASYNSCFLLQAFFSALGTFCCLRFLGASRGWSLVGAWLFFAGPPRTSHVTEHLNILSTGAIPFVVLYVEKWLARPSLASAIALAGSVAAAAYSSLYYLASSLLLILVITLPRWFTRSFWSEWRRRIPGIGLVLGLSSLLLAPRLVPMLKNTALGDRSTSHVISYSPDLSDLFEPPRTHPLLRPDVTTSRNIETQITPGITTWILLMLVVVWGSRGVRRYCAYGLGFYLLSLGPVVLLDNQPLELLGRQIPLPFAVIRSLPGGGALRCSGRLAIVGMLFFAIAIGLGLRALARKSMLGVCILLALNVFELMPAPLPVKAISPDSFNSLKGSREGAVLTIPTDWSIRVIQFEQSYHERPLLFGFSARVPEFHFLRYENYPLYQRLLRENLTEMSLVAALDSEELWDIATIFGVSGLVVYKDLLPFEVPPAKVSDALRKRFRLKTFVDQPTRLLVDFEPEPNSFELSNQLRYYFTSQWFGGEQWPGNNDGEVRWSRGSKSEIQVLSPTDDYTMNCELLPSPAYAGTTPTLTVKVSGLTVTTLDLAATWNRLELPHALTASLGKPLTTISFSLKPEPQRLQGLPIADDSRQIGFAIRNLAFHPDSSSRLCPRGEKENETN